MLIKAQQKFIRTSPRKLRLVADPVRKIGNPTRAVAYLEMIPQKAGKVLGKVIRTAIANATNNLKLDPTSLNLKEIMINEGPTYKRGNPVSRGRFHAIQKKTSHITVVLESKERGSTDDSLQSTASKKAVVRSRKTVVK